MTPNRDADKLSGTIIAALLLCGGSFFVGRVTAPDHVRYRAAPKAIPATPIAVGPVQSSVTPEAPGSSAPASPSQVWVNLKTGVYHLPGSRWYGNTADGKYMSESDALSAGYRRSQRG